MNNLLLLSNSTNAGMGYLEHAWQAVLPALDGVTELVFVPYSLADHDAYTQKVREAFAPHGITVKGVHEDGDPVATVRQAQAIFVGGGNTFRLLDRLKQERLIVELHNHVAAGKLYMGASAGTNVAAPTIRTTNDMPIIFPEGFDALGLVPFQINCHYLDADPNSTHAGETRELRLTEFHEENTTPVVAIREGVWIRVHGGVTEIGGAAVNTQYGPALLFTPGEAPREISGVLG
ncbi:dipeptidase PepE [Leucobacter sp. UCMA 4100]|uniref:dipeptidase PepE n=1 Tax=Leucobacter sp. UCMA 4100 TaxID=2810534 RepID=UPI0022EA3A59|nr:dipeptidase PepE [Leucobacter sp. UCMA 4100]MDA3146953.1 dipeptidase PepE [Leucobacter sp. UCMA 4100]